MRKEVRREVRTVLAQSVLTGYLVVVIGVLMTAGLNLIQPGTVSKMTTSPLGQGALVLSGVLYTVGLLLIRRITRIEQ
jgi:tight adherence protein B